jgi:hypothetical protein
MVAKALWMSILVVGVLALGGLGYSAVTLSQNVTINGTAGTWSVAFEGPVTYLNSSSYYPTAVVCNGPSSPDGNSFAVTAGNLGPGDWCEVFGNISNTGSVPVTLSSMTITPPGPCFQWHVEQPLYVTTLTSGQQVAFQITLELNDHASSECQSATGTFGVTFNFVAGAGEHGEPLGV